MLVSHSKALYISASAATILCGVILSGPVAVGLVHAFAPQPPWQNTETFVRNYSWLQSLPYVFGFFIVGGFVLLMSGLNGTGREPLRPLEVTAVTMTGIFASLVFLNYVLQTTFVPQWITTSDPIVGVVTMANPRSLGWALEMYGYGVLGIATAFVAPLFDAHGRQGAIRSLLWANCVISVGSAAMLPVVPGWVLTPLGIAAGAFWNLLVAVLMVLIMLEFRFGRSLEERHPQVTSRATDKMQSACPRGTNKRGDGR